MLNHSPELTIHGGYTAHPLLREFVNRNGGHCYKQAHMRIADLLTPEKVRSFRDAVLHDQFDAVQNHLRSDSNLIHAEFTGGRGIAQAIHLWKSLAVADLLVGAGADLEALTTRGDSPLTMQLRFGTVKGSRFLLDKGVDPNHGTGGHMPSNSMIELIELLLAHGWDINNGQMLHDANHGHGSRVITWLKYGANPDTRNHRGQTPLHLFAARGIGRNAIRSLIKAGANINARDNEGKTPLDLAQLAPRHVAMQELITLRSNRNV
jgi:ankyrin repeat protein